MCEPIRDIYLPRDTADPSAETLIFSGNVDIRKYGRSNARDEQYQSRELTRRRDPFARRESVVFAARMPFISGE